jgi:hypothetical protein
MPQRSVKNSRILARGRSLARAQVVFREKIPGVLTNTPILNCEPERTHQILVVVQIVNGVQSRPEDFIISV